jgi:hypothetical protein
MPNIQHVTDAINHYRGNKSFIKKLMRTDHLAIHATEAYLNALPASTSLSNFDLFCINHFFLRDHPIKPKGAAYKAWLAINYQNFCDLNFVQATQFDKSKKGQMLEFFNVLSLAYQQKNLTEDRFLAFSQLGAADALSAENQDFIMTYSGRLIIPITSLLIALDKAGLNTLTNREILGKLDFPTPLSHAIQLLEKLEPLTQENFDFISAKDNLAWVTALEEMPESLMTAEVWPDLVSLSQTSPERDFRKDIKDYVDALKKKLKSDQIEEASLVTTAQVELGSSSPTSSRFFSETPANPTPSVESVKDDVPKVSFAP